jgi:protein-S-isoprenylcysteine O-methyltransferase Ste14
MWWLTSAPFFALPLLVGLAASGLTPSLAAPETILGNGLAIFAVVSSTISIALLAAAVHAHRRPPSFFHQERDLPPALVLSGPYARVRHPFYLAFLLMFLAAAAVTPSAGTLATLLYALCLLDHTAAREERRLCASPFGLQYRAYMARTGRFLPSLGSAA